jgi:hypothetical protein
LFYAFEVFCGNDAMATANDIRKTALSLNGVTEIDHFDRPAFRTKKRIFAVIRPDGLFLHLPEERKQFLFEADPGMFVKYMWGKTANVIVQFARLPKRELDALIREAWQEASPAAKPVRKPAKAASARKQPLR